MRDISQTNGCTHTPVPRHPGRVRAGGGRLAAAILAAGLALAGAAQAQTMKLGPFYLDAAALMELGYESNVDGVYPHEEDSSKKNADFYWMPGLSLKSQPVPMRPSTKISLSGTINYQDYFTRNDLDTELYNAIVNFQTTHPRLTLGGMASTDYSVDGIEDEYVPGGASRDPSLENTLNAFANWNWKCFRLENSAEFSQERHDYVEYQEGDKDETTLSADAFLDVFNWGDFYYSWERTLTTYIQTDEETDEVTQDLGWEGEIPLELLRHPHIAYSFGMEYKESTDADGNTEKTWDPTHTLTAQDEFQMSKSLNLRASADWENKPSDDEVTFQYDVRLTQLLGPRAQHALMFTQEPQSTLGSNADTEKTTFEYAFNIKDLVFYGLNAFFTATYELSTPLGDEAAETEKTTTFETGLNHTRQITRKLSRNLAYQYTWESSNLIEQEPGYAGPKQEHLVTYGLIYAF